MKSWSEAFRAHVARQRYARNYACVRCDKGPVLSTWDGEPTHISCLLVAEAVEARRSLQ